MNRYNHVKIENNWKDPWYNDNIYEAVDFSPKPKKYILAELPYPSGKYLHLGHMMRYTVPEIYSRYLRMRGYNVLFPMGWDCFGLPAETFAIKERITPQEAIEQTTVDFKKAMQNMGYAIDWNREINTSDPKYYKWTQMMFIKLWENNLAKIKEMPVWWCEELGVLADEEVLTDDTSPTGKKSERGGYPVERKHLKQWVLDIPAYADRLLEDLDQVDYLDSVKQGQINWIGKSEGALVKFEVNNEVIEAFTTRPDTLFGVTFLALSPEHPALKQLLSKTENISEVENYVKKARNLTDMEKQTKEKTGVKLEGIFAKHPFEEVAKEIPIFVADYILSDYGTGAIMGVPAHDERDFEFAQKYDLEIIEVIEPEHGVMINSKQYNEMPSEEFKIKAMARLEKENKGQKSATYKIREQVFSRQRYWGEPIPLVHKQDGSVEAVPLEQLPLELPIMKDFLAGEDGISPLEKNPEWNQTTDSSGKSAKRETDTMPTWAGSNWYYIRYIDPHNDKEFADMEKLKYWMPVDNYYGDAGHTTAHLIYSRFWYKFLYDQGMVPHAEPYKWRMSGGMLLAADHQKMSKSRPESMVDPAHVLDSYGADATRIFLAFLGPYDETFPWNENGIKACYRLVKTIYDFQEKVVAENAPIGSAQIKGLHKLIKNVTEMADNLKMNTSVSEIMILTNLLKKEERIYMNIWKDFIKVIAPFAPFVAEELWQKANNYATWSKDQSIHLQEWPTYSEELLLEDELNLPVQINGKMRGTITIASGLPEDEVVKLVQAEEKFATHFSEGKVEKIIFVQDKIINFIIG